MNSGTFSSSFLPDGRPTWTAEGGGRDGVTSSLKALTLRLTAELVRQETGKQAQVEVGSTVVAISPNSARSDEADPWCLGLRVGVN